MNVLKTKDLTKIYGSGTTEVIALNHANISVDQGEFVAVHRKADSASHGFFPSNRVFQLYCRYNFYRSFRRQAESERQYFHKR